MDQLLHRHTLPLCSCGQRDYQETPGRYREETTYGRPVGCHAVQRVQFDPEPAELFVPLHWQRALLYLFPCVYPLLLAKRDPYPLGNGPGGIFAQLGKPILWNRGDSCEG